VFRRRGDEGLNSSVLCPRITFWWQWLKLAVAAIVAVAVAVAVVLHHEGPPLL